jgi:hypothetical protein
MKDEYGFKAIGLVIIATILIFFGCIGLVGSTLLHNLPDDAKNFAIVTGGGFIILLIVKTGDISQTDSHMIAQEKRINEDKELDS